MDGQNNAVFQGANQVMSLVDRLGKMKQNVANIANKQAEVENLEQEQEQQMPSGQEQVADAAKIAFPFVQKGLQVFREQAEADVLRKGAENAMARADQQAEIDDANSSVQPIVSAETGTIDAIGITNQANVRAPGNILPVAAGTTTGVAAAAKGVQPAVTGYVEAQQEEEQLKLLRRFQKWAPALADKTYVERARRDEDAAKKQLETAIDVANTNRAKYTANGDPFLTYYYNQWYGTNEPGVANALSYFQEMRNRFRDESDLYQAELANNRELYEKYMAGKEQYMKESEPRLVAAANFGTPDAKRVDAVQYNQWITAEMKKQQTEYANDLNGRFKRGEPVDPRATPSIITGVFADMENGRIGLEDGIQFLDSLASLDENFDNSTQMLAESLRNNNLGAIWKDEAIRAAKTIANDGKLRRTVIGLAQANRNLPKNQRSGFTCLRAEFNSDQLEVLSDAMSVWESNKAREDTELKRAAMQVQEGYSRLPGTLYRAVTNAIGPEKDRFIAAIEPSNMPTSRDINVVNAGEKLVMENENAPALAKAGILLRRGYDLNNLPVDIVNGVINENIILDSNYQAFAGVDASFNRAVGTAKSAISSFDAVLTQAQNTKDGRQLQKSLVGILNRMGVSIGSKRWDSMFANKQMAEETAKALSATKVTADNVNILMQATTQLAKEARVSLFRQALDSEPIEYRDPADPSKTKTYRGYAGTMAILSNVCANQFDKMMKDPMATGVPREQLQAVYLDRLMGSNDNVAALIALGASQDKLIENFNRKYDVWLAKVQREQVKQAMEENLNSVAGRR